jgi:hypothetical protein
MQPKFIEFTGFKLNCISFERLRRLVPYRCPNADRVVRRRGVGQMRRRQGRGRGTGVNRKVVGAAVFAGVLAVGGVTGLQLASAGEQTKAADIVAVDGQNFDVSGCEALEINAGAVVCDGEELQPVEGVGAAEAAAASAAALETACDTFATDQAAADAEANGENAGDQAGEEAGAEDQAGEKAGEKAHEPMSKKIKRAIAEKYAGKIAEKQKEKGEEAGAAEEAGDGAAAVEDARQGLLTACLTLADAKAAEGDAGAGDAGAGDQAGADDQASEEPEAPAKK